MFKKLWSATLALGLMAAVMMPTVAQAKERHPHIKAAIRELQGAKHELQTAAHDFGGHRLDALSAIDNALNQLKVCMQYDK